MSVNTPTLDSFSKELERLAQAGNLRSLRTATHDGKHIIVDGRRMLNLSGEAVGRILWH